MQQRCKRFDDHITFSPQRTGRHIDAFTELKLPLRKVLSRNPPEIRGKTVWKQPHPSRNVDAAVELRAKHSINHSLRLYALGAIFLLPLSIGVVLVSKNATQSDDAYKISHDIGSMYAQGVDFSQRANQSIALSVAEGVGIDMQEGKGVLILSKIRTVHASDCPSNAASRCNNKGYPVVTERFVLGNRSLRPSAFGTPASLDPASGKVRDWMNDESARAENFASTLKPGEVTYAAECYLSSSESRSGVYSRAMF
jgi:hypothetical protein